MQSYMPGDPCPICGSPFDRRRQMFFWRGEYFDGAVCETHGLWPITGEEMPPLRPAPAPGQPGPISEGTTKP